MWLAPSARVILTPKKYNTAILLYSHHTAGVLLYLYNLWGYNTFQKKYVSIFNQIFILFHLKHLNFHLTI